ncbi:hypothetical protein QBC34DRAFT_182057 [Podospora aff. communis PSN243]|uniref:Uncharacterized protein n=1 Tax=Podospora aff. communis PSN243 TaxID=3040156 RepID=A0AAV9GAF8_9PEZI|nr:hypothetical protein QBC34DRAFT_182057 [Podospora aff. communis PSN243]
MAVVGLLTAAGKVGTILGHLGQIRDAPQTVRDVRAEVAQTEVALRSLQQLLERLDLPGQRRGLIQIDGLRVASADAMMEFSSFETFLSGLPSGNGLSVLYQAKNLKAIDGHLAKIQRHKMSLTFMLTILQCESVVEAHRSQQNLQGLLEKVLVDNEVLMRRLRESRDSFDALSIATARPDAETTAIRAIGDEEADSALELRRRGAARTWLSRGSRISIVRFAFENVLSKSWVYRRNAHHNECDVSFNTSDRRSHAWSVFSGYSLADISVLSVIAMPITSADLENGQYYNTDPDSRNNVRPMPLRSAPSEWRMTTALLKYRSGRPINLGSRSAAIGTERAEPMLEDSKCQVCNQILDETSTITEFCGMWCHTRCF